MTAGRLTRRQRAVLTKMRDEDEEFVYSKGVGYVGLERFGGGVLFGLLRLMAIRMEPGSEVGRFERYTINETGRALLDATPGSGEGGGAGE